MSAQPATAPGTAISPDGVDFHLADSSGVTGVRLEVDWSLGTTAPDFVRNAAGWSLHLPRPAADRLEYQFAVQSAGATTWTTDPGNPDRVPNPFGEKSEIRFPEYRAPAWLQSDTIGSTEPIATPAGILAAPVPINLWSPPGLDRGHPAPLLLANDGSDLADRGSLLRWASHGVAAGPFRVALLDPAPGSRDRWYAAAPEYADHLADVVLPAISARVAVAGIVGLGASLGALSMLYTQRRHPGLLDALVLQSGSYFTPRLDPQESGYGFFDRICAAVSELTAGPAAGPCRVLLTCGTIEENRANNEQMASTLTAQGYDVELHLVADAHTMIGWRDAWSPGLDRLLATVR